MAEIVPRATPQHRIRILSGKLSESRGPCRSEVSCFVSSAGWHRPALVRVRRTALRRDYNDLDFAGLSAQREAVTAFFTGLGYEPDRSFNALHGHQRLLFWDRAYDRQVDVVFDRLRMSHTFDLRDRLILDERTLPLADLLLCNRRSSRQTRRTSSTPSRCWLIIRSAMTTPPSTPPTSLVLPPMTGVSATPWSDRWSGCGATPGDHARHTARGCGASDGATAASGRRTKNDALEAAGANR